MDRTQPTARQRSHRVKIELHIERLILNGLPYDKSQSAELQQALEAELSHLLSTGAIMPDTGMHLPKVQASPMRVHSGQAAHDLGGNLARTVLESVGGER
jgi:hypothetical protein